MQHFQISIAYGETTQLNNLHNVRSLMCKIQVWNGCVPGIWNMNRDLYLDVYPILNRI